MEAYGRWRTIRPLGKGGQGTVYLATDTLKLNIASLANHWISAIKKISFYDTKRDELAENTDVMLDTIFRYGGRLEAAEHSGAVKVLHSQADTQGFQKQLARMKREIKALRAMSHPNIVRILDDQLEDRWFFDGVLQPGAIVLPFG